jgi:hypothetical protein
VKAQVEVFRCGFLTTWTAIDLCPSDDVSVITSGVRACGVWRHGCDLRNEETRRRTHR